MQDKFKVGDIVKHSWVGDYGQIVHFVDGEYHVRILMNHDGRYVGEEKQWSIYKDNGFHIVDGSGEFLAKRMEQ